MKKLTVFVFVLAASTFTVGAQDFSVSVLGGPIGNMDFVNQKIEAGGVSAKSFQNTISFGGFAGADLTYAEISASFLYALGPAMEATSSDGSTASESRDKATSMLLTFDLLLKYPIELGDGFYIFPLLGAEYQFLLSRNDPSGSEITDYGAYTQIDYNTYWLRAGVGADIALGDNLFIRPELLYGIRLLTQPEKDAITAAKTAGVDASIFGHGPLVKIAVGWRFGF
jgi:hypothetical protein